MAGGPGRPLSSAGASAPGAGASAQGAGASTQGAGSAPTDGQSGVGGERRGSGRGFDPARMMDRFKSMTPDEQKQFIARMKDRGQDTSAFEKELTAGSSKPGKSGGSGRSGGSGWSGVGKSRMGSSRHLSSQTQSGGRREMGAS